MDQSSQNGLVYNKDDEQKTNNIELRQIDEKQTRFQVNRVRNESAGRYDSNKDSIAVDLSIEDHTDDDYDEDDVHTVTDRTRLNSEYAKSFRYYRKI